MGLAQTLTSANADRIQNSVGIKTLKMAMDAQKTVAGDLLKELGQVAYQAAGIGQNVDIRV